MNPKDLHPDTTLTALLSALLVTSFGIVIPQLRVIHEVSVGYYNALPVSQSLADFDRDGIPNSIDDSDGDTISDMYDATPFGTMHAAATEQSNLDSAAVALQ